MRLLSLLLAVPLLAATDFVESAGMVRAGESMSPGTLSGWWALDQEAAVAHIGSRLPRGMSVATHGRFVVAASGPVAKTRERARRIDAYDAEIRRHYFPRLDSTPMLVIVADQSSDLVRLAKELYPDMTFPPGPTPAFYHRSDRLIVASAELGDGAVLRELTRALVQSDNPDAPRWFEDAMATLYETSEWRMGRLTPLLDWRMARIPADEDLAYDIFAGICDCSEVTAEQLALIRLLLVYLHERGRLAVLYDAIGRHGRYVTLLQALEVIDLDRDAWKAYAERRVREFRSSPGEAA